MNQCYRRSVDLDAGCLHGECQQGYGEPKCICDKGYFGRQCENKMADSTLQCKLAVGVHNVYPWFIGQGLYTNVKMGAFEEGDNAIFTLKTSEGFFAQAVSKNGRDPSRLCDVPQVGTTNITHYPDNKCQYVHPMVVRFPFRFMDVIVNPSRYEVSHNFQLLGYWAYFNFTVTNNLSYRKQIEVYHNTFKVWISYFRNVTSLVCITLITLQNCANTVDDPTVYARASGIIINSYVSYTHTYKGSVIIDNDMLTGNVDTSYCPKNNRREWRIWKISTLRPHEEDKNEPYKVTLGEYYLVFAPFEMPCAMYKVVLETRYVYAGGKTINFEYCYMKVECKPLVIIIDQGNEMYVNKSEGARYTASQSKDPNLPRTKQGLSHLTVTWYCSKAFAINSTNSEIITEAACRIERKSLKTWETFIIPPSALDVGTRYEILAQLSTDYYDNDEAVVRILMVPQVSATTLFVFSHISPERITLKCIENCRHPTNLNKVIVLKVEYNRGKDNNNYVWTYYTAGGERKKLDDIRAKGTSLDMLVIKESVLERGTNYTVEVSVENKKNLSASYSFITDTLEYNKTCDIRPLEGIKGYTSFEIKCAVTKDFTFQYEFYDKYEDEVEDGVIYSGRMLGSSSTGDLQDFRLTRGNLIVYIVNDNGLSVNRTIDVKLSDWDLTMENITEIKNNLTLLVQNGENLGIVKYVSFVPDVFPREGNRQDMLNLLLNALSTVSVADMGESKLGISTMKNVVTTMNKKDDLTLLTLTMKNTLRYILRITKVFNTQISLLYIEDAVLYTSPNTARRVAAYILGSVYSTITLKKNETIEVDEDFIDLDLLIDLKHCSKYAEDTLELVKEIMIYLQTPGEPPTKITSAKDDYSTWTMVHDPHNSISQVVNSSKDIPIEIKDNLMNELLKKARLENQLCLQFIMSKHNLYWWSRGFLKSNLLLVTFAAKHDKYRPKVLIISDNSLDIYISVQNITSVKVSHTTKQLDENVNSLKFDLELYIHRLDLVPRTFTQIRFIFPDSGLSLRVLIMKNYRPDYTSVVNQAKVIDNETSLLTINTEEHEDNTFYYVAVLPKANMSANTTVRYTFEIKTTRCQTWVFGRWVGRGCQFGQDSDENTVHCLCTHTSTFSVGFPVTSHELNPFADYGLFVSTVDNFLIPLLILLLLLLYLTACIWAAYKDKKDKLLCLITVLDDNYPTDRYPYLVSVATSGRFDAGTTAHVALKLVGDVGHSRVHILSCGIHKVLNRNSEDWFIVFCPAPLGRLFGLHLWHDNYGSSPSWFCEKICVYDLKEKIKTVFFIGQWLSMRIHDFPEAQVLPASIEDIMSEKRRFFDNINYGMQETHVMASIFLRHARSRISRLERVTILMCSIMLALLCSVLFFSTNSYPGVDDNELKLGLRELVLSIVILIVIFFCIIFLKLTFRKAVRSVYIRREPSMSLRTASVIDSDVLRTLKPKDFAYSIISADFLNILTRREKYLVYRRFLKTIKMISRGSMIPVHLPNASGTVKLRRGWYFMAWTICISFIIISCFFVVLRSLKFGDILSQKCLMTAALAIGEEVFVFGPLRIFLISLLFSLALERLFDASSYDVQSRDLKYYRRCSNRKYYYKKLLEKRSSPMYVPPSRKVRTEIFQNLMWVHNWISLIDFLVALLFIIVLSYIASCMWSSLYHFNYNIKQLVTLSHAKTGAINFYDITDSTDTKIYLQNTFIRALYTLRWYNEDLYFGSNFSLDVEQYYRTSDSILKMLGGPKIRQLRVEPISCIAMMNPNNVSCIPAYYNGKEDRNTYASRWKLAQWSDMQREYSPWKFTERSTNWVFAPFKSYGASHKKLNFGGYMCDFGATRTQFMWTMTDLEDNSWFDPLTRVVVVELTIYNANKNLFAQVTMFVEYSVTGISFLRVQVYSLLGNTFTIWHIVFMVFIIFFVFDSFLAINREGLLNSLSLVNVLRLLVIVFSCTFLVLLVLHVRTSKWYINEFYSIGAESYFDFDTFVYYSRLARMVVCFVVCVGITRVLCLLRAGTYITRCFHTFEHILSTEVLLFFTFVIFIFVQWTLMAYLQSSLCYRSLSEAFTGGFNKVNGSDSSHTFYWNFLILKVTTKLILTALMYLLVMFFVSHVRVARTENYVNYSDFNFASFILEELNKLRKFKCK